MRCACLALAISTCLAWLAYSRWDAHEDVSPGWRLFAPDDAGGLPFRLMLIRRGGEAGIRGNLEADTLIPTADCCSSNAQWAMSSEPIDAAVMCPDAARRLLEKDGRYELLGPCLLNADVLVSRPGNGSRKVAFMQNRGRQADALLSLGMAPSDIAPMLPAGIPYALERGFVSGGVVDVLTAMGLEGVRSPLASGDRTTYVLVARRAFKEGPEWAAFAHLYDRCAEELTADPSGALLECRDMRLNREEMELWRELRVAFPGLPGGEGG